VFLSGCRSFTTSPPARRADARQLMDRTRSPETYSLMSAYSMPSPFTRATSLPVNTCVSRGGTICRRRSVRGYTFSRSVRATARSHTTIRSGSRQRTSSAPTSYRPQVEQRSRSGSVRSSPARSLIATASAPSATSTPSGRTTRISARSTELSASTATDAPTSSSSRTRSSSSENETCTCGARPGQRPPARTSASGATTTASSGRRSASAATSPAPTTTAYASSRGLAVRLIAWRRRPRPSAWGRSPARPGRRPRPRPSAPTAPGAGRDGVQGRRPQPP
jgi:hypothetical protein